MQNLTMKESGMSAEFPYKSSRSDEPADPHDPNFNSGYQA